MAQQKFRDFATFTLRLPPAMKQELEEIASKKLKGSLNSEIVQRLAESFTARHDLSTYTDGELVDELIKRWGRDAVLIRLGKEE